MRPVEWNAFPPSSLFELRNESVDPQYWRRIKAQQRVDVDLQVVNPSLLHAHIARLVQVGLADALFVPESFPLMIVFGDRVVSCSPYNSKTRHKPVNWGVAWSFQNRMSKSGRRTKEIWFNRNIKTLRNLVMVGEGDEWGGDLDKR